MTIKKEVLTPDFCIIGGGSGGLSFTAGAVQMGASVVLVEHKKMGGDCLNYGCVPSKALIAASKYGNSNKKSLEFGWNKTESKIDFKQVFNHIKSVIDSIAPHDSKERFEKLGAKVILDKGNFLDHSTLETKKHLIKAKKFIIATGSFPFIPPINGIDSVKYYTNENIFDLKELPKHLVVIGGGPIGVEISQAFNRLGSKVTILEGSFALPKDDPEATSKLKNILLAEGIIINEHVEILSTKQKDEKVEISYKNQEDSNNKTILATHLLIATGRRANIKDLNLESAGVRQSRTAIEVDKNLRTSNSKIYAIGDCVGGYQFTHVAAYHAGIAIRNSIFKMRSSVKTNAIPWVTYTDPELAHVGYQESQLKDQNITHKVLSMPFTENDRAQAEKKTEGMIKILVSPSGYILGATILGPNAGELIYPWVICIQNKLKISTIVNSIAPYPTFSDINKRVAGEFYKDKIFSPFMKKIVKFMMWWS